MVRFGYTLGEPLSSMGSIRLLTTHSELVITEPVKPYRAFDLLEKSDIFVRAYLRASTEDQDAERAKARLETFARERGLKIAAWYVENASGAKLARPELFRLLGDAQAGDILLVEQVDRLSRLARGDWEKLKTVIQGRGVRVVALDVPTSHAAISAAREGFMPRILDAINSMLVDILAAMASKDYEDRRRRVAEGIAKAKAQGKFKGRVENTTRNAAIMGMLKQGMSWSAIIDAVTNGNGGHKLSRSTLARLSKRLKA
jgi:DNA invertase Pin-like site-specific DNA recombinase